jgi:hypothetical protein
MQQNTWGHVKDERTEAQVKENYLTGKQNELKIFSILSCPKFKIDNDDVYGSVSKYQPDFFVYLFGEWQPAEIKYTEKELTYIDLKKNQGDELSRINGLYLQFTPTRFCVVRASHMVKQQKVIGYCNKECYRLESPPWKKY